MHAHNEVCEFRLEHVREIFMIKVSTCFRNECKLQWKLKCLKFMKITIVYIQYVPPADEQRLRIFRLLLMKLSH